MDSQKKVLNVKRACHTGCADLNLAGRTVEEGLVSQVQ